MLWIIYILEKESGKQTLATSQGFSRARASLTVEEVQDNQVRDDLQLSIIYYQLKIIDGYALKVF